MPFSAVAFAESFAEGFTVTVIFTVSVALPEALPVTVITARPGPFTVTLPFLSTVATFLLLVLYVTVAFTFVFTPRLNALFPSVFVTDVFFTLRTFFITVTLTLAVASL